MGGRGKEMGGWWDGMISLPCTRLGTHVSLPLRKLRQLSSRLQSGLATSSA